MVCAGARYSEIIRPGDLAEKDLLNLEATVYRNRSRTYNKFCLPTYNLVEWPLEKVRDKFLREYPNGLITRNEEDLVFQLSFTDPVEGYSKIGFWSYGENLPVRKRELLKEGLSLLQDALDTSLIVEVPWDYQGVRKLYTEEYGFSVCDDPKRIQTVLGGFGIEAEVFACPIYRTKPAYDELLLIWENNRL